LIRKISSPPLKSDTKSREREVGKNVIEKGVGGEKKAGKKGLPGMKAADGGWISFLPLNKETQPKK